MTEEVVAGSYFKARDYEERISTFHRDSETGKILIIKITKVEYLGENNTPFVHYTVLFCACMHTYNCGQRKGAGSIQQLLMKFEPITEEEAMALVV